MCFNKQLEHINYFQLFYSDTLTVFFLKRKVIRQFNFLIVQSVNIPLNVKFLRFRNYVVQYENFNNNFELTRKVMVFVDQNEKVWSKLATSVTLEVTSPMMKTMISIIRYENFR